MKVFRNHWYDLGGLLAIACIFLMIGMYSRMSAYQFLMWFNLMSLFLHQLEEYRWPGTFPGMLNEAVEKSTDPIRFPLNTNTALIINVTGWLVYFLAAIFAEKAIWLGIAAMMISFGNFIAHTVLFNIRGKTIYNAGLITSWLLFMPAVILFLKLLITNGTASTGEYIAGILLGIALNLSIPKIIALLARKNSPYAFLPRQMLK